MNIKKIFLSLIVCLYTTLCAQGENDNWYFGNKAAVNFSNTTPTTLNDSQMSAYEACGTASDENGKLLFYMNSQTIWNRQHQPMQNGTGLFGSISAQQLIIVKNPANSNQYFVFITATMDSAMDNTNRISYSIVDMSLGPIGTNGQPLGAVLQNFKNIGVTDNAGGNFGSEAITAVAGATANTYWILIPRGNSLYSYKIDNTGFSNGNPVISNLNFPVNLGTGTYYSIKASPRLNNPYYSNLLCVSYWGDNSAGGGIAAPRDINRVVSFDSSTGVINTFYSLNINSIMTYLPEFNQNGSVLFLGNQSIYAIDLINSTTNNVNYLQIYNDPQATPYYSIQRNKHGNIYISKIGSSFLGVINNPNTYGSGMSVTINSINLGSGINSYGLPQLIPVYKEGYFPCTDNLTLTSEPNIIFNYVVGNTITTQTNYVLTPRHNITMQAGNMIHLLPGTRMENGSAYHGFISPCRKESLTSEKMNKNQTDMVLDLDRVERKALTNLINIYPNPASAYINIDSGNEEILSWELFDVSGRSVLKGSSKKVNVQNLPKANYILKISTNNQEITKKVIVK
ncbi:T9SS type A sorting domain-containing protein [Chryseobacterium salviniae]|uniref:T9SS type A sorting domain-containing protein n=1 Tax=Chryseobacterium salviniae TaxID=3101750 RepID=A0ABU6HW15_9FLAO|nr:T9SS type A sorting domain-containing protein [Chryseobacterium sp. T9W2-O]MEC3877265.1 T9SS type A sorting domain-containing protein [Chryseobacterium sp. T9W2-O]